MDNRQLARRVYKVMKNNEPPKPKLRKRKRPFQRKAAVLREISGCRGIWTTLAERLGCCVSTVQRALRQPGWENVLEAFEQEKLRAMDKCVNNVFDVADYSIDDGTRLAANRFILEKLHPNFHPSSKVVIEGGDNPLRVQHVLFQVPAEILNRPVEDRLEILEAMDVEEKRVNGSNGTSVSRE